jgi:hypothetical protein
MITRHRWWRLELPDPCEASVSPDSFKSLVESSGGIKLQCKPALSQFLHLVTEKQMAAYSKFKAHENVQRQWQLSVTK